MPADANQKAATQAGAAMQASAEHAHASTKVLDPLRITCLFNVSRVTSSDTREFSYGDTCVWPSLDDARALENSSEQPS